MQYGVTYLSVQRAQRSFASFPLCPFAPSDGTCATRRPCATRRLLCQRLLLHLTACATLRLLCQRSLIHLTACATLRLLRQRFMTPDGSPPPDGAMRPDGTVPPGGLCGVGFSFSHDPVIPGDCTGNLTALSVHADSVWWRGRLFPYAPHAASPHPQPTRELTGGHSTPRGLKEGGCHGVTKQGGS